MGVIEPSATHELLGDKLHTWGSLLPPQLPDHTGVSGYASCLQAEGLLTVPQADVHLAVTCNYSRAQGAVADSDTTWCTNRSTDSTIKFAACAIRLLHNRAGTGGVAPSGVITMQPTATQQSVHNIMPM